MKKKPRIALCISGQPRSFMEAYPYIKKNLIDCNPNVDVFLHCWFNAENAGQAYRKTSNTMTGLQTPIEKLNTPELLRSLYKPTLMLVEPQVDFTERALQHPEIPRDTTNTFGSISMWTSIKRCNDLRKQYENTNGFTYDYVIRHRFDCIIPRKIHVTRLQKGVLHGHAIDLDGPVCLYDQTFIGSSDELDSIAGLVNLIDAYLPKVNLWNNERMLAYHLQLNKIPVQIHRWYPILVRGESARAALMRGILNYAKSEVVRAISLTVQAIPLLGTVYRALVRNLKKVS